MSVIEKVLVVDDDKALLGLAEMSLTQLGGLNVKAAGSGEEALEILTDFQPDIVLLDSNMPDMDGPETLAAIRAMEVFKDLPIAFLTGESRQSELDRLMALGAIDVITKPYDPMTLPDRVKKLGDA